MSEFTQDQKTIFVNRMKLVYSANNPQNPTGKSYHDFTSEDLKKVHSGTLLGIRRLIAVEEYDVVDQILPRNMNRTEFARAILRETARRGEIEKDYISVFSDVIPNYQTQRVSVLRQSFGKQETLPEKVTELAAVIAIRDAGLDVVLNNAASFNLQPDVAKALGKSGKESVAIAHDATAYDLGYTTGAMRRFNQGDSLHIRLESPLSPNQLQEKYCPVVQNIFQEGRAYNNRDSFALAFMQARIDSRSNFDSTNDRVGLFADCPATKKTVGIAR